MMKTHRISCFSILFSFLLGGCAQGGSGQGTDDSNNNAAPNDLCRDVTCSDHGRCEVVEGNQGPEARCVCDPGYVRVDLACVTAAVQMEPRVITAQPGDAVTFSAATDPPGLELVYQVVGDGTSGSVDPLGVYTAPDAAPVDRVVPVEVRASVAGHPDIWASSTVLLGTPAVGFLVHHWTGEGREQIPQTGATVIQARIPWAEIQPDSPNQWDDHFIDQEVSTAQDTGVKVILLLEFGPWKDHVPAWLRQEVWDAGEDQRCLGCGQHPVENAGPSIFSSVYESRRIAFIQHVVDRVRQLDPDREVVIGYYNGCEHWYWDGFGQPDMDAFRQELQTRYGSLQALNGRWQTSFGSFAEVDLPRLMYSTSAGLEFNTFGPAAGAPPNNEFNADWATTAGYHPQVMEGRKYTFSAQVSRSGPGVGMTRLQVEWNGVNMLGMLVTRESRGLVGTQSPVRVEMRNLVAPPGAFEARLVLKSYGRGRTVIEDVHFRDEADADLIPAPGGPGWRFWTWHADEPQQVSHSAGGSSFTIDYHPSGDQPYLWFEGNVDAAIQDYSEFMYRAWTEFLNATAREIKAADPGAFVANYTTLGQLSAHRWDKVQWSNIASDFVAFYGDEIEFGGPQGGAQDGYMRHIIAAMDMTRPFRPFAGIDVMDYARGMAAGPRSLRHTSLSMVQHGASQMFYYCWSDTYPGDPDPPLVSFYYNKRDNWLYDPYMTFEELTRMVRETRRGIQLTAGAEYVADVALVSPRVPYWSGNPSGLKNDSDDFLGWAELLAQRHIGVDVLTAPLLHMVDLSRYAVVVLPDSLHLSTAAVQAIKNYLASAGAVIHSGRLPAYDEYGEVLSVQLNGQGAGTLIHAQDEARIGAMYIGELAPASGELAPAWVDDLTLAVPTGNAPRRDEAGTWANNALAAAGYTPLVTFTPPDVPVETTVFRRGAEVLEVFILRDVAASVAEPPSTPVQLNVKTGGMPVYTRVYADLDDPVEPQILGLSQDDVLSIQLPDFELFAVVWIELPASNAIGP